MLMQDTSQEGNLLEDENLQEVLLECDMSQQDLLSESPSVSQMAENTHRVSRFKRCLSTMPHSTNGL